MIIICGNSIAEVERDLEMAKKAIASGMPYGVGGATMADVEKAMAGLRSAMGEHSPIEHKCACEHTDCACAGGTCYGCGCCDEEEVEYCPICDCELDVDGYCDNCGYPDEEEEDECEEEDEEPTASELAEEIDRTAEKYGLPPVWAELMKKVMGL